MNEPTSIDCPGLGTSQCLLIVNQDSDLVAGGYCDLSHLSLTPYVASQLQPCSHEHLGN